MNKNKILFPVMLFAAILLTCMGLVSASKTMANPDKNKVFSVYSDYVDTDHITLIDNQENYISYIVNLDTSINTYTISFDMINNGDFDAKLMDSTVYNIPYELQGIVNVEITNKNELKVGDIDNVVVKYTLKDSLNESEKNKIKNNKDLKVNLIMNYNQA